MVNHPTAAEVAEEQARINQARTGIPKPARARDPQAVAAEERVKVAAEKDDPPKGGEKVRATWKDATGNTHGSNGVILKRYGAETPFENRADVRVDDDPAYPDGRILELAYDEAKCDATCFPRFGPAPKDEPKAARGPTA